MTLHNSMEFYTKQFSICSIITRIFWTTAIFKRSVKENNVSNKLIGMSMVFHCTVLCLSKCSGSWVVSLKQNVHFNFQPSAMIIFLVVAKVIVLKVVRPLKICQYTKFMVACWLVQVLHPPQNSEHPAFWNGRSYRTKNYGVEVTFSVMTSLLNFIKFYHLFQKLTWVDKHTDRKVIS
jgi:hypothetical protein